MFSDKSPQILEDFLSEIIADGADPNVTAHTNVIVQRRELHDKQVEIKASRAKRKMIRAGRRGGKTVLASDIAVEAFLDGRRVLYATPTSDQITKFWYEVKQALQDGIDHGKYKKNESSHVIEVVGTENRIRAKTAWNADTLRGDFADVLILDEFQLMTENTWDEVGSLMLMDNNGDAIFIYTPPSLRFAHKSRAKDPQYAAKMFEKAKKDKSGRWAAFHFTSHDNPYISEEALAEIVDDISETSYRQEVLAEDVNEAPGALWTRDTLEKFRVKKLPDFAVVVVAIDPSATSTGDDAGIIGAGMCKIGDQKHFYAFRDETIQGSPAQWAQKAIELYYDIEADYIVAEKNNGGEMVSTVIHQIDPRVKVKLVWASRGKQTRADPVSTVFEKGRGHIVGNLYALEDELCLWVPGDPSPNRLDAMVWAGTQLVLKYKKAGTFGSSPVRAQTPKRRIVPRR